MSNMSYCRHENTYNDLLDVYDKWDDFDESVGNDIEIKYRKKLLELCHVIIEECEL